MDRWTRVLSLFALLASALPAVAQDYPNRPIRVIASQGAGGLSDVWMRAVGDQLGPILGGTVVIEDRAGAAGTIGARACAESAPDGYTFCILSTEALVTNPSDQSGCRLRPDEEPRAGDQGVLPAAGVRSHRTDQGEVVR